MKNYPFHKRLGFAIAGLREGWRRERSIRTHLAAAAFAAIVLCILRPAPIWWAVVAIAVALVLALELLNGALEALIDHLHPDVHPEIRVVKDMAAAGVLLAAVAAVLIGVALIVSLF